MALFMTCATACSTLPIALPNNVPTARPTFLALRVAPAGTFEAAFEFRTVFLTCFENGAVAFFIFRLMVWAVGPIVRRVADSLLGSFSSAPRTVFLATIFFNGPPFVHG